MTTCRHLDKPPRLVSAWPLTILSTLILLAALEFSAAASTISWALRMEGSWSGDCNGAREGVTLIAAPGPGAFGCNRG